MAKEKITSVKGGERIEVLQMVVVKPKCEENAGFWYCVTHQAAFPNQMMKDSHINQGKHLLAWVCNSHGYEQP